MRLKTFRVVNCFGFADSGVINLDPPGGVVFVLGRNSSGKTSFLQALRYLEFNLKPSEYKNFLNFNPTPEPRLLIAEYSIDEAPKGSYLAAFVKEYLSSLGVSGDKLDAALLDLVERLYNELFKEIAKAGKVSVEKLGNGDYSFFAPGNRSLMQKRQSELTSKIRLSFPNGKLRFGPSKEVSVDLTAQMIENQVFQLFPSIAFFGDAYKLKGDISNRLTADNLKNPQSEVEAAFIKFIGPARLSRFLVANDPDERDDILKELKAKAEELCVKVSLQPRPSEAPRLIDIILHEKQGLQITLKTDGKKSFYQQCSDNTKILIAYHLYLLAKSVDNGSLLLFDEPNTGFHPSVQEYLLEFMNSLAASGNQVILTTHSEHMIDLDRLHAVLLMRADDKGMIRVDGQPYKPPKKKGDLLSFQPIMDAIGLRYGMGITLAKPLVLVEGITDLLYLRAARKILGFPKDIAIAPARGDSSILTLLPFFIGQGIEFRIVIDSGPLKKKLHEDFTIPDHFVFEVPVPKGFSEISERSGIEDLFSRPDFLKMAEAAGVNLGDPRKVARLQNSELVKNHPGKSVIAHRLLASVADGQAGFEFDEETTECFHKILEFCCEPEGFQL